MLQCRGRLDLDDAAVGAEHCGELRLEHLDRDFAIVLEILGDYSLSFDVSAWHKAIAIAIEDIRVGRWMRAAPVQFV